MVNWHGSRGHGPFELKVLPESYLALSEAKLRHPHDALGWRLQGRCQPSFRLSRILSSVKRDFNKMYAQTPASRLL
jgi:hypothetical protein